MRWRSLSTILNPSLDIKPSQADIFPVEYEGFADDDGSMESLNLLQTTGAFIATRQELQTRNRGQVDSFLEGIVFLGSTNGMSTTSASTGPSAGSTALTLVPDAVRLMGIIASPMLVSRLGEKKALEM